MIVSRDEEKYYVNINVGRPDLLNDTDRENWKKVHDFIKDSKIPIIINGAFNFIDEYIVTNQRYGGGGFKYMFWFESIENRDVFISFFITVFPPIYGFDAYECDL